MTHLTKEQIEAIARLADRIEEADGAAIHIAPEAAGAIREWLATRSPASPQAGMPEGWKLVPVELSQEQLDRVLERASLGEFNGSGWLDVYRAVYREAVAAAVQPPAQAHTRIPDYAGPGKADVIMEDCTFVGGIPVEYKEGGPAAVVMRGWTCYAAGHAPQTPAAESRAQAAGVDERQAFISAALSALKQDYSADCLKMASTREYVEDAVGQLIDAGFRAALAATPSEAAPAGRGGEDPLYDRALAIFRAEKRVTHSLIQSRLCIGYNRASRLIERMEARGDVTPEDTDGHRALAAQPTKDE